MFQKLQDILLFIPMDTLRRGFLIVLLLIALLFPVMMVWVHQIDDNLEFNLQADEGGTASASISYAINLIDREINRHEWTPNDPLFRPGAWLDRMPAYQEGIISAISRFAIEMGDQIGRTRGSSQIDVDLDKAAGLLKYPPDVWFWNFSVSLIPTASSEKQYLGAMKALRRYNQRLARGEAVFERRADNLQATLDRISLDLGAASAAIANRMKSEEWVDNDADVLFYDVKGRMYAYHLLLQGMRQDFAQVIAEKQLTEAWKQLEDSMAEGATLNHFFVFNNDPESQFLPNHLSAMGFYLLRARTQIKEVSNILLK
jgi:hypothetical protein